MREYFLLGSVFKWVVHGVCGKKSFGAAFCIRVVGPLELSSLTVILPAI